MNFYDVSPIANANTGLDFDFQIQAEQVENKFHELDRIFGSEITVTVFEKSSNSSRTDNQK